MLSTAAWLPREDNEAWYWTLTRHFETLNAIERFVDAYPWRIATAQERWERWCLEEGIREEYRRAVDDPRPPFVVVCVGRKAAAAIGLAHDRPWFEWLEAGTLNAVVVPHTSGRNRVLNDERMLGRTGTTLLEAIGRAGRPCPFDTDGDGDCGRKHCPACGRR